MSWVKNQQDASLIATIKENAELPDVEEYTDQDYDSEQE